jgi:hypothetical protein
VKRNLGKEYKIVVAGDVTIDWLQWTAKYNENFKKNPPNWAIYPGTRMKAEHGGALLLAKMVKEATNVEVATHELDDIEIIPPDSIIHSVAGLDAVPLSKNEEECKDKKKKIFRVKHHGGYCGPLKDKSKLLPISNDNADAKFVIIDDAGNGFRDEIDAWPKAIREVGKYPTVILKMSQPLACGALWDHLTLERKANLKNLILIIDANDLRRMGVNISRHLSWEQTIEDFYWQVINNPEIKSIAACRNLIVRFGLDGAIHYTNVDEIDSALYYDPNFGEGGYKEQYEGDMQGLTAAFVAAFAAEVSKEGLKGIENGILEGIQRSRLLLKMGFGDATKEFSSKTKESSDEVKEPFYPISKLFEPNSENKALCKVIIPKSMEKASVKKKNWRILEECTRGMLESISQNVVKNKTEEALKRVPSARFGNLFTLDREEIESFQSIKNLISEYLERIEVNVPLSIAVFGSPGSGKSFGVTELALSLDQKRIEKMEFNVSQFTSVADLASAFHKVRDLVLKGKVPLVFFDEFDSDFNGNLGWLKYFLAPMQDGMFKDGETMHPIGRSIFVFAGGTSYTFQQFSQEYFDDTVNKDDRKKMMEKFSDAKGTDFVSRLRGHVNIMGVDRTGPNDSFFIIRRALLLRSLLNKKVPQIFDDDEAVRIDSGVLRAFLRVPTYKHGVRSMEAIIDMSTLAGRRQFTQAALPPSKQLEMHVNSEFFLKIMLRDVLFKNAMERLAIEIHEQYLIDQKKNKNSDDLSMQPWEKLREDLKDSNRKQAEAIAEKLRRIDLDFMPYIQKPEKPLRFSEDQIEFLAELEHERWVAERKEEGWERGSPRDPEKKISPYLIPWSDPNLTEDVKDWDRNAVRKIPELLEKAGFEVYTLQ